MRINLLQAIQLLHAGHVVAVPTETVYGLAAPMNQPDAVEKIYQLKGRPRVNPLIVHIAEAHAIMPLVTEVPETFEVLASIFWPGPMTCVLPVRTSAVPSHVRSALPTAGFRLPASTLARALIHAVGPLVMPSANLSGRPSSTAPEHVEEDFGEDFPVLDGGKCTQGVESTILIYELGMWGVIRLGALAAEAFEPYLGYCPRIISCAKDEKPICPGMMFRHYAPRARLLLEGSSPFLGAKCVLGFQERVYPHAKRVIVLGSLRHPEGVAENLYHSLRQLDREGIEEVYVDMDFPQEGLWITLAERLRRAGA